MTALQSICSLCKGRADLYFRANPMYEPRFTWIFRRPKWPPYNGEKGIVFPIKLSV